MLLRIQGKWLFSANAPIFYRFLTTQELPSYRIAYALLSEIKNNCFHFSTFDGKTPFQLPSNEVFQEIIRNFRTRFFEICLLNRGFLCFYGYSSHKRRPEQLLNRFP